jgi:hypothetical protein
MRGKRSTAVRGTGGTWSRPKRGRNTRASLASKLSSTALLMWRKTFQDVTFLAHVKI